MFYATPMVIIYVTNNHNQLTYCVPLKVTLTCSCGYDKNIHKRAQDNKKNRKYREEIEKGMENLQILI